MTQEPSIDQLVPTASAQWFGERFARIVDPTSSTIKLAAVWLFHQLQQGHTCLDFDLSVQATLRGSTTSDERARVSAMAPAAWLADLVTHQHIQQGSAGSRADTDKLLVLDGRKLFLASCRHDEIEVANKLCSMATSKSAWHNSAVDAQCAAATSPAEQAVAVATRNQLIIVTGGPGTGKTTIASRIADAIVRVAAVGSALVAVDIALVAPTGKAAKRLGNSARAAAKEAGLDAHTRALLATCAASTIHSALSARGEHALAHKRLVIVDECSMIDLALMRSLLKKIHKDATLVLLGDAHQLVSVEAGSVFADILPRDGDVAHPLAHCTIKLVDNYRFPADGVVAKLAAAVNDGEWNAVQEILEQLPREGVQLKVVRDSREVVAACHAAYVDAPESRVLCGHRRGPDGALAINRLLAKLIGKAANPDAQDGDNFEGRPIIVTVNDEVTGLSNGDTGVVQRTADGELVAKIEGSDKLFPLAQLPRHEAAYALTIHKSQGSEYPRVIVVLPAQPSPVVTRELLYTAITRTHGDLLIIATEESLRVAVEQRVHRASGLRQRMISLP